MYIHVCICIYDTYKFGYIHDYFNWILIIKNDMTWSHKFTDIKEHDNNIRWCTTIGRFLHFTFAFMFIALELVYNGAPQKLILTFDPNFLGHDIQTLGPRLR